MKKPLFLPVYLFLLLTVTVGLGFFPGYNWDMLPYMALIKKMDGVKNFDQIHSTVYNTVQKNLPKKKYEDLVDPAQPYRVKMQKDAAAFESQLPFFDIKPIYLLIAFIFYKLGVSLSYATVLPSVVSFFFINVVSFFWCRKFNLPTNISVLILILICIVSFPLAIRSNPDTLACLFLLISSYFFLETDNLLYSILFLLLSVLTRPENIIFSFLLLSIVIIGKWNKKVSLFSLAIYLALLLLAYYIPVKMMNYPGWGSLIYHAFIDNMVDPAIKQTISLSAYVKVLRENVLNIKGLIGIVGLLIISIIIFKKNLRDDRFMLYKLFFLVVIAWTIIKTLLFPMPAYRFFIPPALFIFFVLIKEYQIWLSERKPKQLST